MNHLTRKVLTAFGLALMLFPNAQASQAERIQLEKGAVKLQVPEHWQKVKGFLGVPLLLVGPVRDQNRPVISVIPTGLKATGFDDATMKKDMDDYRDGRRDWLKRRGGTLIGFDPYATEHLSNGIQARSVGFRYELGSTKYTEKSYYLVCKDKFYHLKSVIRVADQGRYGDVVAKTIKSFSCE